MAAKVLSTTRKIEIISKIKFAMAVLNADDKTFMVHITALVELSTLPIHPSSQAQVASLTSEKTGISAEYSDFFNIFSSNSAVELVEHNAIIDHPINLLDNKQPPHSLIYSLGLVELETLKT